jgi:hypothetical protein
MTEISAVQPTIVPPRIHPYQPSGLDRYTDWVDKLPMSAELFYVAFAAILIGLQLVIQWNGSLDSIHAFPLAYILTIPYALALMHYLDKVAAQTLARFRPLMSISDAEYDLMRYRLTTLPARPVVLAALIGVLNAISVLIWIPYPLKVSSLHFTDTPLSLHFNQGLSLFIWAVVGILVYHTLHQLRVVWEIYASCSGIDLYKLRPLYAFSTLSAWTAIGIALMVYVWYISAPLLFNIGIAGLVFFTALSLLTFVLPLSGARHLLVDEKERQLSENRERQRLIRAEMHRRIDAFDITDMEHLSKTIAALELEHAAIDRISTWPWKPETARTVTVTLFFPMVVWLTQLILRRVLES